MNVNQYAERVLFSEDLSDKLRLSSETVEFDFQQSKFSPNLLPGRPDSLKLSAGDSPTVKNLKLPSRPSLVNDRNRGLLLHFFANHELLAAELMALALLKFPDAPKAFREGLFQTLVEEQKHTLWYLGRMKECGVSLGEFPVSQFFWDTVSTMESPLDYVSRLSLTFEQANLDYSRHFAGIMKEAGDERTGRILEKIYQDEIQHVGYGLQWFRHWKPEEKSDWDSYRSQLDLPLSPSRAKGNGINFNRKGRLEAGLTEDFVRQLDVYQKSKGRTPNLFHFNPDAEDRIAALQSGASYQPPTKVSALIHDLEILQIFLARQDDVILMRKPPSLAHLERLKEAGFQLPEIQPLPASDTFPKDNVLIDRQIHQIKPWSAAPGLPEIFGPLQKVESKAEDLWNPNWEKAFDKSELINQFSEWTGNSQVCQTVEDVESAISNQGSNTKQLVLKRSISAAGRGVYFAKNETQALKQARKWLDSDPRILLEPFHQRVFDFSVQFIVSKDEIRQVGFIQQKIHPSSGRYQGSISSPKFCKGLPAEWARFLMEHALPEYEESQPLAKQLHAWANHLGYSGPLGIDAYLHRSEDGELAHRIICEINPRHTMGRLTHEIRRQVAPGHSVHFAIEKNDHATNNTAETDPQSRRINQGKFILNEIDPNTCFVASVTVDKNPEKFNTPLIP